MLLGELRWPRRRQSLLPPLQSLHVTQDLVVLNLTRRFFRVLSSLKLSPVGRGLYLDGWPSGKTPLLLPGELGWRSSQQSLPEENLFMPARGRPGWISLSNPAERMRPQISGHTFGYLRGGGTFTQDSRQFGETICLSPSGKVLPPSVDVMIFCYQC